MARFEVTGSETVEPPAGTFDPYIVDVDIGDRNATGTWHLRTDASHHVVKSTIEQSTARGRRTITQTLTSMKK
jgi:hypothetical protein